MNTLLGTLGIGADSEALYREVLRHSGRSLGENAAALGWDDARLRTALAPLHDHRLVRHHLDDTLSAPAPRRALTRLVEREAAHLELRRQELSEVAGAVEEFAAAHRAGRIGPTAAAAASAPFDVVAPDGVPGVVEDLLTSTTGPIRSFHLGVAAGPATDEDVGRRAREVMREGRELRSIYPVGVLDDPQHLAWVREWAAIGERQRMVESVPAEFAVFGAEAVVAAPTWGEPATSAVLVRSPLLVAAFTAIFDEAWAGGLPVPDQDLERDAETRLLTLLASGFKDEAIARYLGLGVRTVRRRVAALMDELSVHTRFQLGVVAERRGLLGRRP